MPRTSRLRIGWESDRTVTGLLSGPGEGSLGILLAHGAGAGQAHPFLTGLRARLATEGYPTLSFDYPYIEAGRRAPDRLERLVACHHAAAQRLIERVDSIVLAGKSMGGRVGGHVAATADLPIGGIVYYGYPLIPLGKTEPRSTDHLDAVRAPQLFIQGARDRMGPPGSVGRVVDRMASAELRVVDDADHGFSVPKRTGLTGDDVLDLLAATTIGFVRPLAGGRTSPS